MMVTAQVRAYPTEGGLVVECTECGPLSPCTIAEFDTFAVSHIAEHEAAA